MLHHTVFYTSFNFFFTSFRFLPQLHNTGNVSRGKDASDVVEVTDKQAAIRSTGEGHWSQQFVAISLAITAGAGDTAPAPITHYGADHWRLLGDEDVLTVAFVQDACRTRGLCG